MDFSSFLNKLNKNVAFGSDEGRAFTGLRLNNELNAFRFHIGDGFIPAILDVSMVDDVVEVSDDNAIQTTRQLGTDLGLLVGISSGANVWAARRLAEKIDGNIATVLPDRAERYFSTALL